MLFITKKKIFVATWAYCSVNSPLGVDNDVTMAENCLSYKAKKAEGVIVPACQ